MFPPLSKWFETTQIYSRARNMVHQARRTPKTLQIKEKQASTRGFHKKKAGKMPAFSGFLSNGARM
jgi:hypothetical protein